MTLGSFHFRNNEMMIQKLTAEEWQTSVKTACDLVANSWRIRGATKKLRVNQCGTVTRLGLVGVRLVAEKLLVNVDLDNLGGFMCHFQVTSPLKVPFLLVAVIFHPCLCLIKHLPMADFLAGVPVTWMFETTKSGYIKSDLFLKW